MISLSRKPQCCDCVQEILTQGSVDFEDASRLEYDRRRNTELLHKGLQLRTVPASADRLFIRLLVNVLNKASLPMPTYLAVPELAHAHVGPCCPKCWPLPAGQPA